jgi:hypothetical protein
MRSYLDGLPHDANSGDVYAILPPAGGSPGSAP